MKIIHIRWGIIVVDFVGNYMATILFVQRNFTKYYLIENISIDFW